jgi:hypothetical protein
VADSPLAVCVWARAVDDGCGPFREGPLCANCIAGYHASSGTQTGTAALCEPCPSPSAALGGTIGFTLVLLTALLIMFLVLWRSDPIPVVAAASAWKDDSAGEHVFTREDRAPPDAVGMGKILIGFLQIATSVLALTSIPWPSTFESVIRSFSFINLSFSTHAPNTPPSPLLSRRSPRVGTDCPPLLSPCAAPSPLCVPCR